MASSSILPTLLVSSICYLRSQENSFTEHSDRLSRATLAVSLCYYLVVQTMYVLQHVLRFLSKYHGRASRDTVRAWSCWAATMIHGLHYEQDYGQCYEPDYGQHRASGSWQCCTLDQLQLHSAAGPSDQRTEDTDTYQ
jgi:hypothetical protein